MEKDCGMWINILSHMLKKRMNANTQSLGITGVQSHVMHYILVKCADGPVFQRDVESAFGMSRSTATGILQLMEKNGFIYRESVEKDARLKRIVPTKKAEALRPSILYHINESEAQMTQGISKKDVAVCKQVLLQMLQNLSENKL